MSKLEAIKLMRKVLKDIKRLATTGDRSLFDVELGRMANEALLAYDSAPSLKFDPDIMDKIQIRAEVNWALVCRKRGGDASGPVSAPVAVFSALEEIDHQLDAQQQESAK